jgi:hypothetical protein
LAATEPKHKTQNEEEGGHNNVVEEEKAEKGAHTREREREREGFYTRTQEKKRKWLISSDSIRTSRGVPVVEEEEEEHAEE